MEAQNITFRMDKADKQQFERIVSEIGLNLSSAFNIFAKAVIRERAIPFKLQIERDCEPNEETLRIIDENEKSGGGEIVQPENVARRQIDFVKNLKTA